MVVLGQLQLIRFKAAVSRMALCHWKVEAQGIKTMGLSPPCQRHAWAEGLLYTSRTCVNKIILNALR